VAFADGLERAGNTIHPTLEAMRFYTDFARPTRDVYSWNEKMGNALEQFARGRTAFYLGFSYDRQKILARGPQLTYDVAPIPQLSTPINVANYWLESVVKRSKKQNEAWDFIRFISLPNNLKKYSEATGAPSPLRAQVAAQTSDPRLAPFASQVLTAKNWYRGRDIDAASAALKNAIKQTLLPVGATEDPLKRDVQSIIFAAQVMQQTL
jgi:maltose-binding protein MalE